MIWRGITLICCGIVGGWLGVMASDRHPPVKFYSNEILNSPHPGEVLRVRSVVWRDRTCHTTVHRLIFDRDDRFVVPDVVFADDVLPRGNDSFIVAIPVSPVADPGPATYRTVHSYRCNILHWIWPITVGPVDQQFTIAPQP